MHSHVRVAETATLSRLIPGGSASVNRVNVRIGIVASVPYRGRGNRDMPYQEFVKGPSATAHRPSLPAFNELSPGETQNGSDTYKASYSTIASIFV